MLELFTGDLITWFFSRNEIPLLTATVVKL